MEVLHFTKMTGAEHVCFIEFEIFVNILYCFYLQFLDFESFRHVEGISFFFSVLSFNIRWKVELLIHGGRLARWVVILEVVSHHFFDPWVPSLQENVHFSKTVRTEWFFLQSRLDFFPSLRS